VLSQRWRRQEQAEQEEREEEQHEKGAPTDLIREENQRVDGVFEHSGAGAVNLHLAVHGELHRDVAELGRLRRLGVHRRAEDDVAPDPTVRHALEGGAARGDVGEVAAAAAGLDDQRDFLDRSPGLAARTTRRVARVVRSNAAACSEQMTDGKVDSGFCHCARTRRCSSWAGRP
jgi:hypothetical protein